MENMIIKPVRTAVPAPTPEEQEVGPSPVAAALGEAEHNLLSLEAELHVLEKRLVPVTLQSPPLAAKEPTQPPIGGCEIEVRIRMIDKTVLSLATKVAALSDSLRI